MHPMEYCPLPCAQLSNGFSLLAQVVPVLPLLPVPHQESLLFFLVLVFNEDLLTLRS